MNRSRAVQKLGTALLVALLLLGSASSVVAQAPPNRTLLDVLVQRAAEQVQQHFSRALGSVAQRSRNRVYVLMRQAPPQPGTILEAVRGEGANGRVVARLEVVQSEAGLTECRELERVGRAHADPGDLVRLPLGAQRVLVAPCIPLVDLAQEIPDLIGEKLRATLLTSPLVRLVDVPEAEQRAESAYLSGSVADFLARQQSVDEVLFPVLLPTPGKLVLNLEYFGVKRGRATEIEVVSVALDDHLRAWLRAGRPRQPAPPGFRRLPAQLYEWRVVALGGTPSGGLLVIDRDSARVMQLEFPMLHLRGSVGLGPATRTRRDPWCTLIAARDLQSAAASVPQPAASTAVYVLSDERPPRALIWNGSDSVVPQVSPPPADLESTLERLWSGLRGSSMRRQEARWWPAPEQLASVLQPCLADLDADGRPDVVWSDSEGTLRVKLAAQRNARAFPGFGDAKAVQPVRSGTARAVLWLTDPVWHDAPDRLHAAQLAGDELQLSWSSEPFDGTLAALTSVDLNADGNADLVAAETVAEGTRLHAFLALPSEPAGSPSGTQAAGKP